MMQIQSLGGAQPVTALVDSVVRQNAGAATSTFPGATAAEIGGLQKNAVTSTRPAEKQTATMQDEVDQAVDKINDAVRAFSQKLEFSVDKDTEAIVVKVIDKETKEVIRQIPSEELLQIAKALDKLQQGLLIKDQA